MNGKPLVSIDEMIERLQQTKDQPVDLTVLRGNQTLNFHMQPVLSNTEDPKEQRYRLGFLNKERDQGDATAVRAGVAALARQKTRNIHC